MFFHCEYPPYESLNVIGCGRDKLSNWLLQNIDESNIVRSGKSIKDLHPPVHRWQVRLTNTVVLNMET